jgi:hypothetical protein
VFWGDQARAGAGTDLAGADVDGVRERSELRVRGEERAEVRGRRRLGDMPKALLGLEAGEAGSRGSWRARAVSSIVRSGAGMEEKAGSSAVCCVKSKNQQCEQE